MATWGAWSPNSTTTKRMRLGMDFWYTGDPAAGYVTVHKILYAECYYRISDTSNSSSISGTAGSHSGSLSYVFPADYTTITVWAEHTENVAVAYGSTTYVSAAASVSGIDYIGSSYTVSVSVGLTLPARPYSAPTAPTIGTNTRNSDVSNTIGWTNNATTAAPYTNLYVERSTDGGSYSQVASLAGSATSYNDTTTTSNHSYKYRVRASNSAGYSSYSSESGVTYNTPAAPTNCVATKTGDTQVSVTCTDNSNTETGFTWEHTTNGGASWSSTGTTGAGVTTIVHDPAPSGTVAYRVKATRSTLVSAWSATSNSVTTTQAPAAPTVAAWSAYSHTGTTKRVSWTHNSLDGSSQTAATIVYTRDGVETTYALSGSQAYYDIPITGYAAAKVITAKVRTKGLHADYGPYSAVQSTTLADEPQATITTPAVDATVVTDVPLVVAWTYTDALPQSSFALALYRDGLLVHTWTGTSGTAQSIPVQYLTNDSSFSVSLMVRNAAGFEATVVRTFSTDYVAPTVPEVYATWDVDMLAAQVVGYEGELGALPMTDHLALWRLDTADDGTVETEVLADPYTNASTFIDYVPRLNQSVTYRCVAFAANGAYSYADVAVTTTANGYFAVNFGDGDGDLLRLKWNPKRTLKASDDSEVMTFAGRELPVVYAGEHTAHEVSFAVATTAVSDIVKFRQLKAWRRATVWRDIHGQRMNVKWTSLQEGDDHTAVRTLGFEGTVVE